MSKDLPFWLGASVVMALTGTLYYLTLPPEWILRALHQRTWQPKMWR